MRFEFFKEWVKRLKERQCERKQEASRKRAFEDVYRRGDAHLVRDAGLDETEEFRRLRDQRDTDFCRSRSPR